MSAYSLPVLMYHYVSRFPGAIAVSPEHFEDQCRGMAEHGWRGIGLDEAEGFLLKGAPLPPRSLLITFDDGYLDNYVYAWPILRKYGHKGVVFAVTERMEAEKKCRPTLAEVWEGLPPSSLPPVDAPMHDTPFGYQVRRDMFFSWEEARHMESSGVMGNASTSPERGRTRSTRSTSPKSGACPASKNAPSCTAGHSSLPLIWSPPCSASCRKNRRRPVLSFNRREI